MKRSHQAGRRHKIKVEMQAEIYRKDGTLRKRYPFRRINSLIKQFILLLMVQAGVTAQTIKNTAGGDVSVATGASAFRCNAPSGTTTYGPVIGTGTNAVTMTDYALQTQVTTNIAHALPSFLAENPDASTWRLAITRVFTNNKGVTLDITEVGLYVLGGAGASTHCIDRTLYSVSVPNGENLSLTYRITVTL